MLESIATGHKKALVLAAGGGNDIVSAAIPAMHLAKQGLQVDIAGMLSPGAVHVFGDNFEQPVNAITDDAARFLNTKKPLFISFIDGMMPGLARKHGLNGRFYDFSTRFGTKALLEGLKRLSEENNYDLIVGVDVGGDILARGPQDSTILSPMMDFTTLYLLGNTSSKSVIVEFGLGTDGELRPEGIKEIMRELNRDGMLLETSGINLDDPEVMAFSSIYDCIKEVRHGHTAFMLLQTLMKKKHGSDINARYRFRYRLGEKIWQQEIDILLEEEYFGKTYVIDAKKLYEKRRATAFPYDNSLEQIVKLKKICPSWKTEFDLSSLWSGKNWTTNGVEGYCMQVLLPSKQLEQEKRKEIIQQGLYCMDNKECDLVMMLAEDLEHIEVNHASVNETHAGDFYLLSKRSDLATFMRMAAQQIKVYQKK